MLLEKRRDVLPESALIERRFACRRNGCRNQAEGDGKRDSRHGRRRGPGRGRRSDTKIRRLAAAFYSPVPSGGGGSVLRPGLRRMVAQPHLRLAEQRQRVVGGSQHGSARGAEPVVEQGGVNAAKIGVEFRVALAVE